MNKTDFIFGCVGTFASIYLILFGGHLFIKIIGLILFFPNTYVIYSGYNKDS